MSAHLASIFALFSLASSLFFSVLFKRSARRHIFTAFFALVHMPIDFQRKPLAWHSSKASMTSAQLVLSLV